ncbi:MAG: hypothetical protein Q8K86_07135 [Candidatus Nanopelagicaceae bacterium]|nr:hypothetical protein [Candidatus Nanopelagicaceae bacterium]
MKIDYAIMSADDNPLYFDFWPIVSKLWKERFDIEPILLFFGSKSPPTTHGRVIYMPVVPNVPIYLQCLWSRYWFPATDPNKTSIISDIDMLPLSPWYFQDQIHDVPESQYVHLNPCMDTYGLIPSCYHVARGSTFGEVLQLPQSWERSINEVFASGLGRDPGSGQKLWFTDEQFATRKIQSFEDKRRFTFIKRPGGQNGWRIDRPHCAYDLKDLKAGKYFDCHANRPFSQHKNAILAIADTRGPS